MTETLELQNNTMLYDPQEDDGTFSVLSLWHRVHDTAVREQVSLGEATQEISRQVECGQLVVVTDRQPSIRTCTSCGCSDDFACGASGNGEYGCFWVREGLCSRCHA
jgi:hypothetical protein